MRALPSGTVTFLFTDVEGSTRLLHELGAEQYAEELATHRRLLRDAFTRHGGVEVDTQGDAFFIAFPTAPGALAAAADAIAALEGGPIRVRIGLHTGTPLVTEEGYVGEDVHRAARIAACGHGGQVLVSGSTAALLTPGSDEVRGDALGDLGLHRLKDLSAPERIFQLGGHAFPPLKSLYRTNLPFPATPFLGREAELADVASLLARDDVRLLTLTGPGGTGKTRLALQAVAAASDAYPDGVFWVPLAPLRDPALVLEEASAAVGASDGLADHVGDKRLLLLLDNFEHLVDAAADLLELLASCPNLQLVVTSRELLRLHGEHAYPVPPLAENDGIELFTARARAVSPAFAPDAFVPEICRHLDDLPLALELAAARVRALTPEQLLERLGGRLDLLTAGRGVDPRQQTLRATIEWSHDLLDDDEKHLYARISVFRGGCTLDAAEQVCAARLDTVQALVDKSLLRYNEDRYWMLETVREHASEQLQRSGEADELCRRHADYYLALAMEGEPHLRSGSTEWLERLGHELDNLRTAFDRLETSGDGERVLALAGATWLLWEGKGHLKEAVRRLEAALAHDGGPTIARAGALLGAATMSDDLGGDLDTSFRRAEDALAIYRAHDDVWGTATALLVLGLNRMLDHNPSLALGYFEESADGFRRAGDVHNELQSTRRLAWAYEVCGDLDRARATHQENLARARGLGDAFLVARTLAVLAQYDLEAGRVDDSVVARLKESHALHRTGTTLENHYSHAILVTRFAFALSLRGALSCAARLLACSERLFAEHEMLVEWWVKEMEATTLSRIKEELDSEELARAWEEGQTLTIDEAVALALRELEHDAS
jgi:predicted ATPase/class 3 adenylate cyclase